MSASFHMGRRFEALCRHVISRIYRLPIEKVHSGNLTGVSKRRREELRHQIDLYWDVTDGTLNYRVFANAKWRADNVELPDVMALIGVWRDIGAHKAMLITNTGFDVGVLRQARQKGIGLLIVRPTFDLEAVAWGKMDEVVAEVERLAAERTEPLYTMEVMQKGYGGGSGDPLMNDVVAEGAGESAGWFIVGSEGEGGEGGIQNKGMGSGQVPNKMMGGISRKG